MMSSGQEGLYSQENWAEENFEFGEKGSRNKRQDIEPPTKKRPLDNSKPKKVTIYNCPINRYRRSTTRRLT